RLRLGEALRQLALDLRLADRGLPQLLTHLAPGLVVELAPLLRAGEHLDHLHGGRAARLLLVAEDLRRALLEEAVAHDELLRGGLLDAQLARAVGLEGGEAPLLPQPLALHPHEVAGEVEPGGLEAARAL